MNLGYYIGQSYVIAKGQLILKADWHTIDSPKKWTDEFVLFAFYSSRQTNQIRPFLFWENLQTNDLLFEINWPLASPAQPSQLDLAGPCHLNCQGVYSRLFKVWVATHFLVVRTLQACNFLSLLEACFYLISGSSLYMEIQIMGGKITENLGFKSSLQRLEYFCHFYFSFSNSP